MKTNIKKNKKVHELGLLVTNSGYIFRRFYNKYTYGKKEYYVGTVIGEFHHYVQDSSQAMLTQPYTLVGDTPTDIDILSVDYICGVLHLQVIDEVDPFLYTNL